MFLGFSIVLGVDPDLKNGHFLYSTVLWDDPYGVIHVKAKK